MSTARRDDPKLVRAVVGQWQRIADRVDSLADEEFERPGGQPGRTVADVADVVDVVGRVVRSVRVLSAALAGPPPAVVDVTAVGYLRGAAPRGTAPGGDELAEPTSDDFGCLRRRLRGCVGAAVDALDGADPRRPVSTAAGGILLGDLLVTRVVEGVIAGIDLGTEPVRDALRIAVRTLTDLLVERAPGRSVEVRVPPFAAVQVVEGPRHTRGNPPNVVELGPLVFLQVASGRLRWAEAVADGRVRASGSRADLEPYLPLLASRPC